ncbi:MAG: hypothetical protein D4R98_05670 [Comamonadaceae bacterium]|nr:MAG: hypothetical protein D4R98_05670 [Comamonadaceae bacterium]
MMSSKSTNNLNLKKRSGPPSRASSFFYTKSNLVTALLATSIFVGYLVFVITVKGAAFAVDNSAVKSLGTSLGFGQAEIFAFLSERSDQMIAAYIDFNQVWDTLFGLIYGVMYVVWVSLLFKSHSQRFGNLNLLPLGQVFFDWLENFSLAALSNQYLADGTISSPTALLASTFSAMKWVFSILVYGVILVGIVMQVVGALKRRRNR